MLLLFFILLRFRTAQAQGGGTNGGDSSDSDSLAGFQPTLAFVIAMLSIMFSLTFILLLYAKFCHRIPAAHQFHDGLLISARRRFSGLDRKAVESLPYFRFADLRGAKQGLECCVCLNRFEDVEVLRLLPKCKHAFHIDCIDNWLEKHATCPLCRRRVTQDDLLAIPAIESSRLPSGRSELFVRREEGEEEPLNSIDHRIVVTEAAAIKNRWSSLSSPDLLLLNSELVNEASRARINREFRVDIDPALENQLRIQFESGRRSVSEITAQPRFSAGAGAAAVDKSEVMS